MSGQIDKSQEIMQRKRIWLSLAEMSGREQEFIDEAFDTNWVVPLGPNVNGFEQDLEQYLGVEGKRVVALSAGTAAIHLGLVLLGVQRGDEVICQSFTFAASTNPILYQGAKPIFVDSEPDTWNMSPQLLREAIEDRIAKRGIKPKAIIIVHLYGMPAKMDELRAIAEAYNIPILEDAAEALGSEYDAHKCGTMGAYGVLSFNGNKMITTSGGGALICPNEEQANRALFFATQAREDAPYYQHNEVGYNYRLSNISAGIGRGQMTVLEEHIKKRRRNHALYQGLLSGVPGISVKSAPSPKYNSNYWLTCILVEPSVAGFTCEELRLHLEQFNVESRRLWKPMHLQPLYQRDLRYIDGTSEALFDRGLCLPSGTLVSDEDIHFICSLIEKLVQAQRK